MDTVYLHGLKCEAKIGVWSWEKHLKQTLVLDIDIGTDIGAAAASDALADAVNYQRLAERVSELAADSECELLETLAEDIAAMILKEFAVAWVRIKLDKGSAVKNVKNVGVMIERSQSE